MVKTLATHGLVLKGAKRLKTTAILLALSLKKSGA